MSLEEEILALEQETAAIVASARAEAKNVLSALDRRKEHIAKEIAERASQEKKRLEEEHAARVREKVAEIEREKRRSLAAIERAGSEKAQHYVRSILAKLIH